MFWIIEKSSALVLAQSLGRFCLEKGQGEWEFGRSVVLVELITTLSLKPPLFWKNDTKIQCWDSIFSPTPYSLKTVIKITEQFSETLVGNLFLPYFLASSNLFYVKPCHQYLQEMLTLLNNMDPSDFGQVMVSYLFWLDNRTEQKKSMKKYWRSYSWSLTDSVPRMGILGIVYLQFSWEIFRYIHDNNKASRRYE